MEAVLSECDDTTFVFYNPIKNLKFYLTILPDTNTFCYMIDSKVQKYQTPCKLLSCTGMVYEVEYTIPIITENGEKYNWMYYSKNDIGLVQESRVVKLVTEGSNNETV